MWWFTKILLGVLGLGFGAGMIVSGYNEPLGRYILLTTIGGTCMVAIGYLFADLCRGIARRLRVMDRFQYRTWGYGPAMIGMFLLFISGGENETLTPNLILAGIGISLVAVGWVINHWPKGQVIHGWQPPRNIGND